MQKYFLLPLLSLSVLLFVYDTEATNPPTAVLDLSDKFLDVKDEGMWFVEFYAPWCAHCKRLHPVWDQVGHTLSDSNLPIRVGKLDCTRFPAVANKLSIQGYPTILFFRNGHVIDYRGGREKEALVSFAKRCAAPIIEVINENQIEKVKLSARSQPSYVFFGTSSGPLFDAFNEAASSKFSVARFYSVAPPENDASFRQRVAVFKDNFEIEFNGDIEKLTEWVTRERWPGFLQATSSNLAEIGASGKLVVLVVSSESHKFNNTSPIREFHKTAEEASKELRKHPDLWNRFQFAWLDGSDLASQIQMAAVSEPHLFIFNYTSYEYYLSEDEPSQMTIKSILTFLEQTSEGIDKETIVAFGDHITEFIPPFVPLLNDYVITENYNLHACIVRKSMSQLTTNLMCYLSNTALYEDRNRTLSDTWAARKGSCDNIAWSAYAPLYENGTMSMSRMTKLAFIRHPESRFVSFFVDKCINTNSCYGCRDLHCAVKLVYDRLMNHVQNRHLIDQSESELWWFDWHAAPQTWNCDFYKHLTDYHLIKIGTSQKDRKLAMKQLQIALKTANVEDKYIEKIMADTLVSDTKHGTHQSKSNLRILQQVRTDPYVRHYLHRIYYFDYVAFGFEIPEVYSADLPEYPLRN